MSFIVIQNKFQILIRYQAIRFVLPILKYILTKSDCSLDKGDI
jgi:hypothetical protein